MVVSECSVQRYRVVAYENNKIYYYLLFQGCFNIQNTPLVTAFSFHYTNVCTSNINSKRGLYILFIPHVHCVPRKTRQRIFHSNYV